MTTPRAFVFKGVPAPFHHGALGVCRALGRRGVQVAANDESRWAPARRSRFRSESVIWSPWPSEAASAVERLLAWGERQQDRPILIPVDDAATIIVDTHREELSTAFRFPVLPPGLAERLSDKWEMASLATEHGVPTARVSRIETVDALDSLLESFGLPVVVKRIAGWSLKREARRA